MSLLTRVVQRLRHSAVGSIEPLPGIVRGSVQIPICLFTCVLRLSARLDLIRLTTCQAAGGQQGYDPQSPFAHDAPNFDGPAVT